MDDAHDDDDNNNNNNNNYKVVPRKCQARKRSEIMRWWGK